MMMNIPAKVTGVAHPFISSVYLKKDYSGNHDDAVLIIETNFPQDHEEDALIDLLGDLHDLQILAEKKIGHFDRVDIRSVRN